MRRAALAGGLLFAAFVAIAIAAFVSGTEARRDLDLAHDRLVAARERFADGEFDGAAEAFRAARSSFDAASLSMSSLPFDLLSAVPFFGRSFDGASAIAEGGALAARAGGTLADAFVTSGGIEALVLRDGRVALDRLPGMAAALEVATPMLERASAAVDAVSTSWVLGAIRDARADAASELHDAVRVARIARTVLAGLPAFLGAEEPARYFVGAENPAELRGSGGLIGAFAMLTIDEGRMRLTAFRPTQSLPVLDPSSLEPPNADYARLYDPEREGDSGFWLNANMTPDFPSAAVAIERAFEAATGTAIDGVITADPFALAAFVEETGPTEVPSLGITVEADDVVPLLSSEGFALLPDPAERKRVLGATAGAIVERALDEADAGLIGGLLEAGSLGHLKVYSDDPEMQSALARTGAGGALAPGTGDYLAVIANNAAGNKLDYYGSRALAYEVWLLPDGAVRSSLTVQVRNETPDGPLPGRVLGAGRSLGLDPGATRLLLNAYCVECAIDEASADGAPVDLTGGTELGTTFFQWRPDIARGDDRALELGWHGNGVWDGSGSAGTYALTLQGQVTIEPTTAVVRIHLPPNVAVTSMSEGMRVDGDVVTWRGEATRRIELSVAFDTPFPLGVWRDLTSTFG